MSVKYLDLNGLEIYSAKVKELLNNKADNDVTSGIIKLIRRITTLKKPQYFIIKSFGEESRYKLNDVTYNIPTSTNNGIIKIDIKGNINDLSFGYDDYYSNKYIYTLDFINVDTSNVTDMSKMFRGCSALSSLDLISFDTSNVIDMNNMFVGCKKLTSLDLSSFDTSNVINMNNMFMNCESLTSLDLSNFDTSNVKTMAYMFCSCEKLTSLDLSNFDTSNVTYMAYMFSGCYNLQYITCKQAFKNWCITNQKNISLSDYMVNSKRWNIVD